MPKLEDAGGLRVIEAETIVVAAIVALPATVTPILLASLTARNRRREKELDWARQDDVATRIKTTAEALVISNRTVASAAKDTAEKLGGKLDQIHTLVNSKMTEEMQSRLLSMRRELAGLLEIVSLKSVAGRQPSAEALEAIRDTKAAIVELELILNERDRQTIVANKQAEPGSHGSG